MGELTIEVIVKENIEWIPIEVRLPEPCEGYQVLATDRDTGKIAICYIGHQPLGKRFSEYYSAWAELPKGYKKLVEQMEDKQCYDKDGYMVVTPPPHVLNK
jgi:hypothetical protein